MIFPLIILNKIYWYKWRYLQNKLLEEYHQKLTDFPCLQYNLKHYINDRNLSFDEYQNVTRNTRIISQEYLYIYSFLLNEDKRICELPYNYFYSNGSKVYK